MSLIITLIIYLFSFFKIQNIQFPLLYSEPTLYKKLATLYEYLLLLFIYNEQSCKCSIHRDACQDTVMHCFFDVAQCVIMVPPCAHHSAYDGV